MSFPLRRPWTRLSPGVDALLQRSGNDHRNNVGLVALTLIILAFGLYAETGRGARPLSLAALLDLVVGATWAVAAGFALRHVGRRCGLLVLAVAVSWFFGNLAGDESPVIAGVAGFTVFLHRAVIVHVAVSFPSGRLSSTAKRLVVVASYLTCLAPFVQQQPTGSIVWAVLVALTAAWLVVPAVRLATVAFTVTVVVAALLILAEVTASRPGFAVTIYGIGIGMTAVLVAIACWEQRRTAIADAAVELAMEPSAAVRDLLANALGDQRLQLAFHTVGGEWVGEAGAPSLEPVAGHNVEVWAVEVGDRLVAKVGYDPRMTRLSTLVSIDEALRVAAKNVGLRADLRLQADLLEGSRRRLQIAGDERRLALSIGYERGVGKLMQEVRASIDALPRDSQSLIRPSIDSIRETLRAGEEDLQALVTGLGPAALQRGDLAAALAELTGGLKVPTTLLIDPVELEVTVATTVYFICAEAVTNVVKHADASSITLSVGAVGAALSATIEDDGRGGARLQDGSALADRVAASGGRLRVISPAGGGTTVVVQLPR